MKQTDWYMITAIVVALGLTIFCISMLGVYLDWFNAELLCVGLSVIVAGWLIFIIKIMHGFSEVK